MRSKLLFLYAKGVLKSHLWLTRKAVPTLRDHYYKVLVQAYTLQ